MPKSSEGLKRLGIFLTVSFVIDPKDRVVGYILSCSG